MFGRRESQVRPIFDFTSYLFDLDGTIYVGGKALPGAVDTIQTLRDRDKKIMFATNTTVYTREEVRDKLIQLGIECERDEIVTALSVAGMYFRHYAPGAKVLLIGSEAMTEEMRLSEVDTTVDPTLATHVLVGLDRSFDFEKLTVGMNAVRSGALLIAANPDPFCPLDTGVIPDTWALVRAIETASMLQTHDIIGKPSRYYASYVLNQLDCRPEECLMVGDRLETDVELGNSTGMYTALVLSGADSEESIARTGIEPDYVWASIGAIAEEARLQPSSQVKEQI
ncbi:HAD-IIA family hydrolase (plasmid) [Paenibacillus cellulosilyticus]|nr:HAD-IIA family hydrolase [Paenibacillus cellulosilyticus]